MTEEVMLSARVPKELKDLIDADQRNNQEVIRVALRNEFGGERIGELDSLIQEKESRIQLLEKEENRRRQERKQKEKEKKALLDKKQRVKEQEESQLADAMDALETVPWEADNAAIKTWANELDMSERDLINQLEDYYAE